MRDRLTVSLDWRFLTDDSVDPGWRVTRALYAYLAPRAARILYIGKADGCTVRERWLQKESFWSDLESSLKLQSHRVIMAEIVVLEGSRLTGELIADVESLLIYSVRPWGNIQSRNSRIQRPGLVVNCSGAWPLPSRVFEDPRP